MANRLPEQIYPLRLARSSRSLKGRIRLDRMTRLARSLVSASDEVDVILDFGHDETGTSCVRGRVTGYLQLVCQRCLRPMDFSVEAEIGLAIVASEEDAEQLTSEFEPLVIKEEPISLSEMLEDELILALPIIPKHTPETCSVGVAEEMIDAEDEAPRESPFATLAQLKSDK